MSKNTISLEANIGAGKTTFLTKLRENYNQYFNDICEPLDDWLKVPRNTDKNILGLLYEDPKRWGYTFQHNAFFTRVDKLTREYDPTRINITERSVISDHRVFAHILHDEGHINENEWDIYLKWKDFLMRNVPMTSPTFLVYLRLDPEIAHSRLVKRKRKEESGVPLEYLMKVHTYHERWMQNSEIPVLELDASLDFENDPKIFETYADRILAMSWKYLPRPE
jgi:deoxyadenosine/deoxycytidine kinase